MAIGNLDYLYNHLPARYRRDDEGLLLKRFLTFAGEQLDRWDNDLDTFFEKINPDTATEEFIDWWLWALFGWAWFPEWYSLERKRALFADFTTHLARRGTPRGIEEWLKAFSIFSRVYARPLYWGEFYFGEEGWTITDALGVVAQVWHLADEVNHDTQGQAWGSFGWGEGYFRDVRPTLTQREIEDLLRYVWPQGQRVMIDYVRPRTVSGPYAWDATEPILIEDVVPDENSGPVA
jgi:phage tail-like protein